MSITVTTIHQPLSADDEAARNGYNSAFSEMEIDWHWDTATYRELLADGGQPVRAFVERHRPHLLRAYGIDCLVNAVEVTRQGLSAARPR